MTGRCTRWERWLPGSGGGLKVLNWNLHSFQLLEIIQVLDSISWVRCASGNVFKAEKQSPQTFTLFIRFDTTVSNIRHATRSSSKAGSPSRQRRCPAEILVFSQWCWLAWRWRWWTFDISEFLVCFSKEKVRSGMLISMAGFNNKNNSKSVESLLISNWGQWRRWNLYYILSSGIPKRIDWDSVFTLFLTMKNSTSLRKTFYVHFILYL